MNVRHLTPTALATLGLLAVSLAFTGAPALALGSCPNEQFRTGSSAALPDCRAYEMVSPPDKNGGGVDGGYHFGEVVTPEQAATDGEAITYGSTAAFNESGAASALVASQYVSRRSVGGWVTQEITPKQELPRGRVATDPGAPDFSLFQGFNEELSGGFLLAWNPQPDPSAPVGYFNPYLWEGDTSGYQLLSSVVPPDSDQTAEVILGCEESQVCGFAPVYARDICGRPACDLSG